MSMTRRTETLLATALLLLAAPLGAIDLGALHGVVLQGFQTRGTDSQNQTQWELSGKRATVNHATYELEDFTLVLQLADGGEAVLTSPRCRYDEAGGVAESTAPIKVVSQSMTLDGVGYDVLLAEKRLRVRSQVRVTLRRPGGGLRTAEPLPLPPEATRLQQTENTAPGE